MTPDETDIDPRSLAQAQRAIDAGLRSDRDGDDAIRSIARQLGRALGASAVVVWAATRDGRTLEPAGSWAKKRVRQALAAGGDDPRPVAGAGPAEAAFRERRARWGPLGADDPRALHLTAAGAGQCVGIPLVLGGDPVGVAEFIGGEIRRYGPATRAFLDAGCSQLALALEARRHAGTLARYETALEAAGTSMLIHDWRQRGRVVYCSPGFAATAGVSAEEALGAIGPELIGLDARDPDIARLRDAARRGRRAHAVLQARRPDGSSWWCDLQVAPVLDPDGQVREVISVIHDVTARESAIQRLADAEERYRALVERIPLITYVCDLDDKATVRWISPQVEDLLGYPPEAFYDDQDLWASLILPEDIPGYESEIQRQLADGGAFDATYRIRTADGDLRWVIDRDEVLSTGARAGTTLGLVIDVTALREARTQLQESEEFHRTVLGALSEGIVVQEPNGRIVSANAAAARLVGAPGPDSMVGTSPQDWIEMSGRAARVPEDATPRRLALRDGTAQRAEITVVRRLDGARRTISLVYEPLRAADGTTTGTVLTAADVTRERTAEQLLRAEHDRATRYLALAGAVIIALDAHGVVTMANPAACEALARREDEIVGRPWVQFLAADAADPGQRLAAAVRPGAESRILRPDGSVRIIAWREAAASDAELHADGTLMSGLDVTERREAEERIEWLAYHDSLTGLPNRPALREALESAIDDARGAGRGVALLYCDLDGFKQVNDTLGHDGGDLVLQAIAHRLRAACRSGELVARPGGDEFLVLLRDLHLPTAGETARTAAQRIAGALREPVGVEGLTVELAVSVGASVFPDDATDVDEMLKQADAAMYTAKAAASPIAPGPAPASIQHSRDAARQFRTALEEKRFVLHWQPVVSLEDGRTVGQEALVRWDDPSRGVLPPSEFIGFAEQTSLIVPLGEWALEEAVRQAATWAAQGSMNDWYLNVSGRQLERPGFADAVIDTIKAAGLPPVRFTLEVSEGVLGANGSAATAQSRENVAALSGAGVRIAVDDFGAGQSSLARLRDLPLDVLKIDGSLLNGVPESRAARTVFRGVLSLAESLGLETVAEGVETEEQRIFLSHAGCQLAQGFRFSRPVPAHDVDAGGRVPPLAPPPAGP
ncbi:MAG: EAL domain-containing protein [Solirubrobacteraceae bacterium]